MQTNEFYRIPTAAIIDIATGNAKPFQVAAAKQMGRTMNPVVVVAAGMNTETYEMQYRIATNGVMAEVAKLAGLEYVDAFLVDAKDVETAKDLF